ncbi:MAG: hypothetical protein D6735_07665 [Acidobacteria bacterium]|nr:MAG: hypothetical protein D6735_07665 [Acidobacteriota bacterium]
MQVTSELYFIAAMMFLIIIVCIVATFAFYRAYKREPIEREKEARKIERLKKSRQSTAEEK